MAEQVSGSTAERLGALLKGPDAKPNWTMAVTLLVLVGLGAGIAALLGETALAIYTILPFLGAAIGVAMAGPAAGAALGGGVVALMLVSGLAAATPLTAALLFGAVVMWVAIPSRYSPSGRAAVLVLLAFVFASVFAVPGVRALEILVYSGLAALLGVVVGFVLARVRARRAAKRPAPAEQPATAPEEPPAAFVPTHTAYYYVGAVIAAAISAALLYWYLTTEAQRALWIFLSFVFVLRPAHPDTVVRSLQRFAGTLVGFVIAVLVGFLPGQLPVVLGLVALVPAIAYAQATYAISVAASTVVVVILYGAPTGEYVAWGLERTADVAVGAVLAIAVGTLVRWLNRRADARSR